MNEEKLRCTFYIWILINCARTSTARDAAGGMDGRFGSDNGSSARLGSTFSLSPAACSSLLGVARVSPAPSLRPSLSATCSILS